MTLVATFLVNAALSFALSLVLASLLGPDAFGRYAIGLSIATVVNTMLFEWLRLSTTRYQSERAQKERPSIRRTLDATYWIMAAVLAGLTALVLPFGPAGLSRPLLLAASACGLSYGFCEYRMALSRALFREKSYVALAFLRALFGFLLSAGAAQATGDPVLALAGAALAAALPILLVQHSLRAPEARGAPFDAKALARFARYAVPLVAANAVYQLMPLLNRGLLASRDGFVEAGYFALISEIATRLFQNLGTALDIVLFQIAVRIDEQEGREAAERQIARNAGIVAAVTLPAAAGLWIVWPAFEEIFVPRSFRGHLDGCVPFLIPALALYALIQFAVNPYFQLRHRTGPVVSAALVAIGVNLVAALAWPRLPGAPGFALAQFAGLAAGFLTLLSVALVGGARLPWRDLALSALAAAAMAAVLLPTRNLGAPVPTLAGQVVAGGAVYGLLALAFDLCGCRALLAGALARARPVRDARLR
ncbi:oligosaccharide flippase family protein [Enterovirga sp.]|uniref:lipopolysaccharide biosynthesis protein n=1 Tax=Enterovirga sp. TaxID=2026350 RepID=UPI002B6567CE|nr:oligosaccharide flippase family protein [Enterovirga sp.]HMO31170.1 oligosaccharide flippase family protein [Enterovirga sp.]